jgi:hypothetical protein
MGLSRLERVRLMLPAARLAWRYLDDGDAWRSVPHDVPLTLYGSGNLVDDFRFYLEGPSRISVKSTDEICRWLRKCQYQTDAALFGRDDYWQHPGGFEALRRGDCEDHALWAWRKLVELGHKTELVIGRSRWVEATHDGLHAWVVYTEKGNRFLFEAAAKSRREMIKPLVEVSGQYKPYASVDQNLQRHLYAGFVGWIKVELERRRARKKVFKSIAGKKNCV